MQISFSKFHVAVQGFTLKTGPTDILIISLALLACIALWVIVKSYGPKVKRGNKKKGFLKALFNAVWQVVRTYLP